MAFRMGEGTDKDELRLRRMTGCLIARWGDPDYNPTAPPYDRKGGLLVKCIVLAHDPGRNIDRWSFEEES